MNANNHHEPTVAFLGDYNCSRLYVNAILQAGCFYREEEQLKAAEPLIPLTRSIAKMTVDDETTEEDGDDETTENEMVEDEEDIISNQIRLEDFKTMRVREHVCWHLVVPEPSEKEYKKSVEYIQLTRTMNSNIGFDYSEMDTLQDDFVLPEFDSTANFHFEISWGNVWKCTIVLNMYMSEWGNTWSTIYGINKNCMGEANGKVFTVIGHGLNPVKDRLQVRKMLKTVLSGTETISVNSVMIEGPCEFLRDLKGLIVEHRESEQYVVEGGWEELLATADRVIAFGAEENNKFTQIAKRARRIAEGRPYCTKRPFTDKLKESSEHWKVDTPVYVVCDMDCNWEQIKDSFVGCKGIYEPLNVSFGDFAQKIFGEENEDKLVDYPVFRAMMIA